MTLFQLKGVAHDLIYEMVDMGKKEKDVYAKLARRLGVPLNKAHFHTMSTMTEVQRAIAELEHMRDGYKKAVAIKERKAQNKIRAEQVLKKLKPVSLSQKEMKEAIAKAKMSNVKKTLWWRVKMFLWSY